MRRDDWSWKPDAAVREALKRRNRKRKRKWSIRIKKKKGWERRVFRMPGEKFYRTNVWWQLRRKVLAFYGSVCMRCGSVEEIQVDHIKPRSKFPELSLTFENMQVLCKTCNRWKSNLNYNDYRPETNSDSS